MNSVEYFAHPWEFGARRAKELLDRQVTLRGLSHDQGGGQPNTGSPRLLYLAQCRVHPARAEPRALERNVGGRHACPNARPRWAVVEGRPVDPARRAQPPVIVLGHRRRECRFGTGETRRADGITSPAEESRIEYEGQL